MSRAPMTPKIEADTEHAIDFLQLLDKHGRHDLAAIDPQSGRRPRTKSPAAQMRQSAVSGRYHNSSPRLHAARSIRSGFR